MARFDRVCRFFDGVPALREVTMEVEAGAITGLVGENGAGKSTLMNLLGGVVAPDSGSMTLDGAAWAPRSARDALERGVAFIHQELNLFGNLSVAENICLTAFPRLGRTPFIDRRAARLRSRELLGQLGVDLRPETAVERLAPGEKQLVEIARALGMNARVVIFDEPTTSLTIRETGRLFDVIRGLRGRGVTVIYISHILEDVLALADTVAVMRDGELVDAGPVGAFTKGRMIRSMVGREISSLYRKHETPLKERPVLEIRGLCRFGVVRDIGFIVTAGETVGLFGLMGAGRSELLRLVFGLDTYDAGDIRVCGAVLKPSDPRAAIQAGLAMVTDDRRGDSLLMSEPAAANLALAALPHFSRGPFGLVDDAKLSAAADGLVGRLRIKTGDAARQPVSSLSGGNQQKIAIGKWLVRRPLALLLDEPTRGIDVGARHDVYALIAEVAAQGTAVLFASSELEELMGTCDRIMVMVRGECAAQFERSGFDRHRMLAAAFGQEAADA